MCRYYRLNGVDCKECPLSSTRNGISSFCLEFIIDNPEQAVTIVEKWKKEHPIKTRQSELLKLFPNAKQRNGVISICPKWVDDPKSCPSYNSARCLKCQSDYWLKEIE